jgi:hypothetical protein
MGLGMMTRFVRSFVEDGYSVWLVSLCPNPPTGHTVADMADDDARLIEEVDGRADLVRFLPCRPSGSRPRGPRCGAPPAGRSTTSRSIAARQGLTTPSVR